MDIIYSGITLSKKKDMNSIKNITIKNTDYLMIKCASSLDGNIVKEPNFEIFINYAESNKIPYGIYYTTNTTNIKRIEEEAEFVFDLLKNKKIQYPVYIEQINTLDKKGATDSIITFCGLAWYSNIYSGFRCDSSYLRYNLDYNRLRKYNFWLISHSDRPGNPVIPFGMWEHCNNLRVDNTMNMFSENYCIQNYPKTIRQNNLNGF